MTQNPAALKQEIVENIEKYYPKFYSKFDKKFWERYFDEAYEVVEPEEAWLKLGVFKLAILYKTLELAQRNEAFEEANGGFVPGFLPLKEMTYTDNGITIKQVGDSHAMKNNAWLNEVPVMSFAQGYQELVRKFTIPNSILFNTTL
jgi:hypothetical protein